MFNRLFICLCCLLSVFGSVQSVSATQTDRDWFVAKVIYETNADQANGFETQMLIVLANELYKSLYSNAVIAAAGG